MKNEVLVTQSCPTLCNPMSCSPLGASVHRFSRQEYWSGLPFPSPGDLPYPGIEPRSPTLQTDSLPSEPPGSKEDVVRIYDGILCACVLSSDWLCNPVDCNLPSFLIHGISQARILEWGAVSFSRGSSWTRDQTHVSCIGRRVLYHWATRETLWHCVFFAFDKWLWAATNWQERKQKKRA